MNAQDALIRLTEGNRRFVEDRLENVAIDRKTKNELVDGQSPFAIILSCADSRVPPELIFNAGMGELFVVRVAGNVANTSSLASMEYAVEQLGTQLIVVLGHQNCGAVTAAVAGGDNGPNINHLLEHIAPAIKESSNPKAVDEVIRKNTELTVSTISSNSGIIAEALEQGNIKIVPAYYHLDSGRVDFLNG